MENYGESNTASSNFEKYQRIDRGKADEVRVLIHHQDACGPEEWKNIKFMVFDSPPSTSAKNEAFEQRIARVAENLQRIKELSDPKTQLTSNVDLVKMEKCTGFDHLYALLSDILEKVRYQTCTLLYINLGRRRHNASQSKFNIQLWSKVRLNAETKGKLFHSISTHSFSAKIYLSS